MNRDVIIIGAGASGMMCGLEAAKRGRSVLILDHNPKAGAKILISGGGKCNFTNLHVSALNYVSHNPHFCKSALSRYTPQDFIEKVRNHGIAIEERKWGQLFCEKSAQEIVDLLVSECEMAGVEFQFRIDIESVEKLPISGFVVEGAGQRWECSSVVVATGGLSIPKVGATGFGYDLAKKMGLKVTDTAPALDGFTFSSRDTKIWGGLAGISLECKMSCNQVHFREALLFTHAGLSGPVALQVSLHWKEGDPILINLLPDINVFEWLMKRKKEGNRSQIKNLLSELLPARLADRFCEVYLAGAAQAEGVLELPLPQISERALANLCSSIHEWELLPAGTVGYNKAEVTRGGVDTDELSSKTMEAKKVPGLYFIGEVVDVTGWLGGYNFQWAWSSGWAAGQVV